MSKIWIAIKTAWIYNLSILLIGSILVAGQIKGIKATNQQITSTKQSTINNELAEGEARQGRQLTKNTNAEEKINQEKKSTDESKSSSAQASKQEIKYEQVETENGPTETKVLNSQKIEIPKSQYATLNIAGVGDYRTKILPDETAFTIMIRAARENNFTIDYKIYSFGAFITAIGEIKPADNEFWALYYNGVFSQVGASQLKIKENDLISWRVEKW